MVQLRLLQLRLHPMGRAQRRKAEKRGRGLAEATGERVRLPSGEVVEPRERGLQGSRGGGGSGRVSAKRSYVVRAGEVAPAETVPPVVVSEVGGPAGPEPRSGAVGVDREEVLRDLADEVRRREALEVSIRGLVAAARVAGVSWEVIAQALGVTRQGAMKRYR